MTVNQSQCIEWKGQVAYGYGRRWYKGKCWQAHRAAWDEHIGQIPEGMLVCHKCDNRACVNPEHLFLGTQKDNIGDMDNKGRRVVRKGSSRKQFKLFECQVIAIKSFPRFYGSQTFLAKVHGVTQSLVSYIQHGKKRVSA